MFRKIILSLVFSGFFVSLAHAEESKKSLSARMDHYTAVVSKEQDMKKRLASLIRFKREISMVNVPVDEKHFNDVDYFEGLKIVLNFMDVKKIGEHKCEPIEKDLHVNFNPRYLASKVEFGPQVYQQGLKFLKAVCR